MEIKPCPFCGSDDLYVLENEESIIDYEVQVVCDINGDGCGASSCWTDTDEKAIRAWNRRI